jgi:hypothetical protein
MPTYQERVERLSFATVKALYEADLDVRLASKNASPAYHIVVRRDVALTDWLNVPAEVAPPFDDLAKIVKTDYVRRLMLR